MSLRTGMGIGLSRYIPRTQPDLESTVEPKAYLLVLEFECLFALLIENS